MAPQTQSGDGGHIVVQPYPKNNDCKQCTLLFCSVVVPTRGRQEFWAQHWARNRRWVVEVQVAGVTTSWQVCNLVASTPRHHKPPAIKAIAQWLSSTPLSAVSPVPDCQPIAHRMHLPTKLCKWQNFRKYCPPWRRMRKWPTPTDHRTPPFVIGGEVSSTQTRPA